MAKVRFGLIGYGAWGSHHAGAIAKTDGAQLVAIAARSPTTCAAARGAHSQSKVYEDYRDLLSRPDIDVVDVVLPSHLHHEVGSAVLCAGKHLLIEKPMALSLEQCDDLLNSAQTRKRILAVGHELRLSSLWGTVKETIDAGAVGEPLYVLVELWRRPYRQGSGGWRYDLGRVGSWILEEPIHFFDLARWYLAKGGEPISVYARANSRQADHPELQDNFSAIVNFAGSAYAVISQTLAAFEHHQTARITGTEGSIWAEWSGALDRDPHPTFRLRHQAGNQIRDVPLAKPSGELYELEDEIAMMVRAVLDGTPVAATGADGRWAVAMCLAAQRSVETGTVEPISTV